MKTCWFVAIFANRRWWVDCEGKAYGPFATREDAALEATRLARTFGDSLRQSEVWMPDDTGKLHRVWVGAEPAKA